MKESDKGLIALAVFIVVFYMSKKDKDEYAHMRWGGAQYPRSHYTDENRRLA